MRVIANHAHLMPEVKNGSWWPEGGVETLLKHLDFCGIDIAVVFQPFACQMEDDTLKANR